MYIYIYTYPDTLYKVTTSDAGAALPSEGFPPPPPGAHVYLSISLSLYLSIFLSIYRCIHILYMQTYDTTILICIYIYIYT